LQYVLGGRPEEGVVMGALLLTVAAGNAPLVMRFFAGTPGPPRLLALTAVAGLLLVVVRPPLPMKVRADADTCSWGRQCLGTSCRCCAAGPQIGAATACCSCDKQLLDLLAISKERHHILADQALLPYDRGSARRSDHLTESRQVVDSLLR